MNNVLYLLADVVHHSAVTLGNQFLELNGVVLKFDNFFSQLLYIPLKVFCHQLLSIVNFILVNLALI